MDQRARESYLESQVLTATPQKLRLMLIEAAIGSARKTGELWKQERFEDAVETLIHCRNIVTELLSGIKRGDDPMIRRVTGVYLFLFKALTEAQLRRDQSRLDDVVRVLEIERETWRQVCSELPQAIAVSEDARQTAAEITANDAQHLLAKGVSGDEQAPPTGGLVLDA